MEKWRIYPTPLRKGHASDRAAAAASLAVKSFYAPAKKCLFGQQSIPKKGDGQLSADRIAWLQNGPVGLVASISRALATVSTTRERKEKKSHCLITTFLNRSLWAFSTI